jgi:hypothetical protein
LPHLSSLFLHRHTAAQGFLPYIYIMPQRKNKVKQKILFFAVFFNFPVNIRLPVFYP